MERDGEKLRQYIVVNSRFWLWPVNEWHEVMLLGYEAVKFGNTPFKQVDTIRYYFRFVDGMEKSRDVRSLVFAEKMSHFKANDRLKIIRKRIGEKKYEYEVCKIE